MIPDIRYVSKKWEEVQEGENLPEVVLAVTVRRIILDAAATRDFFPGHHDRDYARAQGVPDIYLNTMFYHGFIDRVVTDWAGPEAWLVKRNIRMSNSISAGDIAMGRGVVTKKYQKKGNKYVDLAIEVTNRAGEVACSASVTIQLA